MDDPIGRQLLIVVLLIVINSFFAAAEIAVISLNGNKLRHEAEEGNKQARKMLRLVEDPTKFLSTIQIAITLAGFLASAYAADTFSDRLVQWLITSFGWQINPGTLNTLCLIAITLVLSYFTLVFGELVPKRIAMAKSEQVTRIAAPVVVAAGKIFGPVVKLLSVSTNGVLRLFKIDPRAAGGDVSEEEIRMMVDIGEEKGAIEPEEKEMIENIFEFNNITAEDVMIHRKDMEVMWLDDAAEDILARIEESGLSRFPVCGEDIDDVVGLLRTREFLLNAQSVNPKPLAELLAEPYFVPEQVSADVLFRDMQKKKFHMAIVVDEYGGTSGLVTLEDLLEEIVGNIYDEFDPPEEELEIEKISDNKWRVSGGCDIELFCEALEWPLPEEEEESFDTVGGLIFSALSEIPADGSQPTVELHGLRFFVEEVEDRRISWAMVERISRPAEEKGEEEKD